MFTNITHEFRTPLTLILGGVDELRGETEEAPPTILARIERNGRQLLRLVNQMLGLARIESGQLELNLVHAEILLYLRYLTDSFHSTASAQRIELSFASPTDQFYMDFDPEYLQQVVGNLLSNALKFTPEGGRIKVEVQGSRLRKKEQAIGGRNSCE